MERKLVVILLTAFSIGRSPPSGRKSSKASIGSSQPYPNIEENSILPTSANATYCQCDRMASLFVQYLGIYSNKI